MNHLRYRIAIIAVLALAACAIFYEIHYKQAHLGPTVTLNTEGQPTIGYPKALVHVVVFEEPKCSDCKRYNNTIFPEIRTKYIETNKIIYTVIPVSFLPDSMTASIFLECIYLQNPLYPNNDLFFEVLDKLYQDQPDEHTNWATEPYLLNFAKQFPDIHQDQLKECLEHEAHRSLIEKNSLYAKNIMGGTISTPTIYVDGAKVDELSKDAVMQKIDLALKLKGVN